MLLIPVSGMLWAQEVPVPPLNAQVVDTTGTLSQEQQAALIQKLQAFEATKGSQIAVLLVPSTQPETIEQYALRVAENWKIGRKNVDDGAILVVALLMEVGEEPKRIFQWGNLRWMICLQ